MIRTQPTLISCAAFALIAATAAGCNNGGGERVFLASGTIAPIGSQGLLSSGVTEYNNLSDLQNAASKLPAGSEFAGPNLQILSPLRGAQLPVGPTTVEILVEDSTHKGIGSVFVAGQGVVPGPDGKATIQVNLTAGLHTIVAEALDSEGNRTERHVSVLVGALVQEGTEVRDGARVRITDDALDALEPQIGTKLQAQKATIVQSVLSAPAPKNTKWKGFDFGATSGEIDCQPGGLKFKVSIKNVALRLEYKAKILFFFSTTKRGTVRAQDLIIEAVATPTLAANGTLTSTLSQVTARTIGFSVPDWAKGEEGNIRRNFEQSFATQAGATIDKMLTDALTKTKTSGTTVRQVYGKPLNTTWRFSDLAFDADGINVTFGAQTSAPAPGQPNGANYGFPGVVTTGTPNAPLGGTGGAAWNGALTIHQDLINQTLHAAWRQGVMNFKVDQAKLDQVNPGGAQLLSTDSLIKGAPALARVLPAGLPLTLDVEAKLPPVIDVVSNQPQHFTMKLGAVRVDYQVIDPDNGNLVNLAETYYALEIGIVLQADGDRIKFVPTGASVVRVDVVGNPLPMAEPIVDGVTRDLAPSLIKGMIAALPGMKLPALKGFELKDLEFSTYNDSFVVTGKA
ncbi:MAG: hypothetical protein JKY65_19365, partial [Planctomycetes bacterium]|nr:hypothetical protein [Planctomycetota bacterium]